MVIVKLSLMVFLCNLKVKLNFRDRSLSAQLQGARPRTCGAQLRGWHVSVAPLIVQGDFQRQVEAAEPSELVTFCDEVFGEAG